MNLRSILAGFLAHRYLPLGLALLGIIFYGQAQTKPWLHFDVQVLEQHGPSTITEILPHLQGIGTEELPPDHITLPSGWLQVYAGDRLCGQNFQVDLRYVNRDPGLETRLKTLWDVSETGLFTCFLLSTLWPFSSVFGAFRQGWKKGIVRLIEVAMIVLVSFILVMLFSTFTAPFQNPGISARSLIPDPACQGSLVLEATFRSVDFSRIYLLIASLGLNLFGLGLITFQVFGLIRARFHPTHP
jgi:hypothetical protein